MLSIGRQDFAIAPGETAFTALSDAEGRWQIGNLPLGSRASVQLIDPDLAPNKATAPILGVTTPPLETIANGALSALNDNGVLRAIPAASLAGRVLDGKGRSGRRCDGSGQPTHKARTIMLRPTITTTDATRRLSIEKFGRGNL